MIKIAGLIFTGLSTIKDMLDLGKDLSTWEENDLLVGNEWLDLAQQRGILPYSEYYWSREDRVATRELRGTHTVAIAYNEEKRTKCRIVRGYGRLDVLMKKLANG